MTKAADKLTIEELKICHAYVECDESGRATAKKLGIKSEATIRTLLKKPYAIDYIASLKKRYRTEIEAELSISKRFVIRELLRIHEQHCDSAKTQINVLQELSKLMGYYASESVEVSAKDGQSAVVILPTNGRELLKRADDESS